MDEEEIRTLITRIARPRAAGGQTIERAALLAAGPDLDQVITWITDHNGEPESQPVAGGGGGGLHGGRLKNTGGTSVTRKPSRYILPAGVLN
jgi:hypothetical protein